MAQYVDLQITVTNYEKIRQQKTDKPFGAFVLVNGNESIKYDNFYKL